MREEPQFNRLENELMKAKICWQMGDYDKARLVLKLVASIAFADSVERSETGPVAESRMG
jgi:hypothetical protein